MIMEWQNVYNLPQFSLIRVTYVRSSVFRLLVFRVLRCIKCLSIKKLRLRHGSVVLESIAQLVVKCTSACDSAGKEANFVYLRKRVRWARDYGRLIDFVWINDSETSRGGGGGVGVLLLDVYVKMEITDFLLPRSKQKM